MLILLRMKKMNHSDRQKFWYIVKQKDNTCKIVSFDTQQQTPQGSSQRSQWGSYSSEQEAIAKKIGLIRGGKCKPE